MARKRRNRPQQNATRHGKALIERLIAEEGWTEAHLRCSLHSSMMVDRLVDAITGLPQRIMRMIITDEARVTLAHADNSIRRFVRAVAEFFAVDSLAHDVARTLAALCAAQLMSGLPPVRFVR